MRVEDLPAGREMDAIIKKHVFSQEPQYACFVDGCREEECVKDECDCLMAYKLSEAGKKYPNDCEYWRILDPAPYSDNIAAAWEVWEWLKKRAHEINFTWCKGIYYFTTFDGRGNPLFDTNAETFPLAICRIALKALGVDEV